MRERDLTGLIMQYVRAQLPVRGLDGMSVVQNYQPTQQGRPATPAVIIYCMGNKRYGSPRRSWTSGTSVVKAVRTERQYREATYKVTALIPTLDPKDLSANTQGDVVGITAAIMNSEDFISHMKRNNCGVLRISDIVNVPFENDKAQNEANYSFDVIITHSDVFVDGVPVISEYDFSTVAI